MRPHQLVESLESRRLLAGNVAVAYNAGTNLLSITGDNKANLFDVEGGTNLQGVTVTGVGGTTINGQPSVFIDTSHHVPDVNISTGNGDDIVVVHPAQDVTPTFGNLKIDTGNGNDLVVLTGNGTAPNVDLNIDIDTGNGDDGVELNGVFSAHDLNVNLGNGDDILQIDNFAHAEGNIHFDGGHGFDQAFANGPVTAGSGDVINFENV